MEILADPSEVIIGFARTVYRSIWVRLVARSVRELYTYAVEDTKALRFLYTIFLGILLAVFVGVGIAAFYEAPKPPVYPNPVVAPTEPLSNQSAQQAQYAAANKRYQQDVQGYSRNVSIMALCAAVVFVVASIIAERRVRIIADGVMLGGLATLLYSIARSFASADNRYMFIAVSGGLAIVLYLGYHRFSRPLAVRK